MNKLARREYDYIKGNTALKPERKRKVVSKPDKKYKQISKKHKLNTKNILIKNNQRNDRKYLLTVTGVIIVLGFFTILGDSRVYKMEKILSTLNAQVKTTNEENEALKVKIIKNSSLNNIEKNASSKLSMFAPTKKDTVTVDFSKNYFEGIEAKKTSSSTKDTSLLSKLINFIK